MEENRIEIDKDLCNGCGLCVTVCPTGTISLIEDKAAASGGESIAGRKKVTPRYFEG
jgi:ferredoxin